MKTQALGFISCSETYSLVIIILLVLCCNVVAQENMFDISVATDKNSYVLGEPASTKVVISYNGNIPLNVNNPLDEGEFWERIDVAFGSSGEFRRYYTWEEASDALKDRAKLLPRLHYNPGAKITNSFILFCSRLSQVGSRLPNFAVAGSYKIRYTVGLDDHSWSGTADVAFVEPEKKVDQEAWGWLQNQDKVVLQEFGELDHLLAEAAPRAMVLGHLAELLTQYPESVQAKYIQAQITNAENESRSAIAKANAPLSIFEQTVKALESEWYDVKGYERDTNLPGRPEFNGREMSLIFEHLEGKLTDTQFDQQDADLLKTYVKKYCEPLSPDEWKRRNDAYAKEDADRREQQMKEMMSHAAENELLFRAARSNAVPK